MLELEKLVSAAYTVSVEWWLSDASTETPVAAISSRKIVDVKRNAMYTLIFVSNVFACVQYNNTMLVDN
jgi:hypothetical protein